ncbi:MAG: hypothetical protein R3B46_05110 [Phycisphaerales bacterium]|nr:hypothetical protein [Phycisphaerales bacterium]
MEPDAALLSAARAFIWLLDKLPADRGARLRALSHALDSLTLAAGSPEKGPYGVGPKNVVPEKRFGAAFPEFGMYPVAPHSMDDWLDDPKGTLGDAIDDLVDIYRDLMEGVAHAGSSGEAAGAELLRQSFAYHWGEHARLLQLHVHRLLYALG